MENFDINFLNCEELDNITLEHTEGGVIIMALLGAAAIINFTVGGAALGYGIHYALHSK